MSLGFTGEYWIINGEPIFADGEYSEVDHSIIAQHFIRNEILDELGIQCCDWPDLNSFVKLIKQKIGGCSCTLLMSNIKHNSELIPAALELSDPRAAVMQELGWKWVKRNWIATHQLSEQDRAHIVRGLNRIWEEEDIAESNGEIELRVQATGRVFLLKYSDLLQPDLFLGMGNTPAIYKPEAGYGWAASLDKAIRNPAYQHSSD